MAAEDLQRIFRTLSDPTRIRILTALQREELAVQELMEVLGMAQSRVWRHLAILREAGLIRDRRAPEHRETGDQIGHGDRACRTDVGDQAKVDDVRESGTENSHGYDRRPRLQ